jgi:hypothetical protein
MTNKSETEFEKFDAVVRKVFAVPKTEIERREKLYQRRRKRVREKRAKTSPASHAASDRD